MGLELGADDYLAKTFGRMGPDLLQDVQTVLLAEPQIEKDQARMSLFEVGPNRAGTIRKLPAHLQIIGDRLPHHPIVIDDKNVAHLAGLAGLSTAPSFDSRLFAGQGLGQPNAAKQAFGCPSIMGFAGRWNEFGFQSSARVALSASLQRCATSGQRSPIRRHCLQEGPALGPRYGTSFP
jgi:hypothetical protein